MSCVIPPAPIPAVPVAGSADGRGELSLRIV